MGFQKGHPGYKKKGTINHRTAMAYEIINRLKVDPFEVLCLFAKGDWKTLGYQNEVYVKETAKGEYTLGYTITPEMRLQAAKEAVKYVYAQKKETEFTNQEIALIQQYRELMALEDEQGSSRPPILVGSDPAEKKPE